MDEDRLAELEQMLKDANDSVTETEKRFTEVCNVTTVICNIMSRFFISVVMIDIFCCHQGLCLHIHIAASTTVAAAATME